MKKQESLIMGKQNKQNLRSRNVLSCIITILFLFWCSPLLSMAQPSMQISYEGPVVEIDQEIEKPPEYMEQNGKQYQLESVELAEVNIPGSLTYVSANISYELEGMQEPPETAEITIKDAATGNEFRREVSVKEIAAKEMWWSDTFSFPITVYDYEAESFQLGNYEIQANTDLAQYDDWFLDYLNLPQDCYHINSVEWSGTPYEQDGILCRDAVAYGEKLIRDVEVIYGGQVRTPEIPGKQYVAVYTEIVQEETEEWKESVKSEEEPYTESTSEEISEFQGSYDQMDPIMKWVREHLTVVKFGALFLILLIAWGVLLWLSVKKKKAED